MVDKLNISSLRKHMWLSDIVLCEFDRLSKSEPDASKVQAARNSVMHSLTSLELQVLCKIIHSWIEDPKMGLLVKTENLIKLMDLLFCRSAYHSSQLDDLEFFRIFSISSEKLAELMYVLVLARDGRTNELDDKPLSYFTDLEFGLNIRMMIGYLRSNIFAGTQSENIEDDLAIESHANTLLYSRINKGVWSRSKMYSSKSYKAYDKYLSNRFFNN